MKKAVVFIVLLILSVSTVSSLGELKPLYDLDYGEDINLEMTQGKFFRIRAAESAQISLKLNHPSGSGSGMLRFIIDEIHTDKIIGRVSVNTKDFENVEISTNNNLRGTDNHYKVDLYGGNAPELFFRPEITNTNGKKEDKKVVIYFNIYEQPLPGEIPNNNDNTRDEDKPEKEGNNKVWWYLAGFVLLVIIIGSYLFKKEDKPSHSLEYDAEKVESHVRDIKKEHETIEKPKRKVKRKKKS